MNVCRPDDIRFTFNEMVEIYDEVRPSYPGELFDDLLKMLPLKPAIVEVGPGTGQATKHLLARGASVLAIEIGSAMAATLRSNLPSDRLDVLVGDFEVVDIVTAEPDAIFSASAYHWISREAQTNRPAAILRPGGVMAIVDLIEVESPDDAGFFAAIKSIYERYGQSYTGLPAPPRGSADPAIRTVLEEDPRFESVVVRRYDWNQTYNSLDYRNLTLSFSDTKRMEEPDRLGLLDDVESLVRDDFGGELTRRLIATLTTATLS